MLARYVLGKGRKGKEKQRREGREQKEINKSTMLTSIDIAQQTNNPWVASGGITFKKT